MKIYILLIVYLLVVPSFTSCEENPYSQEYVYIYFVDNNNTLIYESTCKTGGYAINGDYNHLQFNDDGVRHDIFYSGRAPQNYIWTDANGNKLRRPIQKGETLIISINKLELSKE